MKKFLSILIITCFISTLMFGCGSNSADSNQSESTSSQSEAVDTDSHEPVGEITQGYTFRMLEINDEASYGVRGAFQAALNQDDPNSETTTVSVMVTDGEKFDSKEFPNGNVLEAKEGYEWYNFNFTLSLEDENRDNINLSDIGFSWDDKNSPNGIEDVSIEEGEFFNSYIFSVTQDGKAYDGCTLLFDSGDSSSEFVREKYLMVYVNVPKGYDGLIFGFGNQSIGNYLKDDPNAVVFNVI